ncbi:hypothetical protein E4U42_005003 [Claviceps africana]|uniref:Uncharacterized protein n=1 Tax=Claviceps africana TaxID=83212 RepID=A0A8K0J474_9HYPO|nr:hypothetical protein E4U42_005003 [Claviceps africana]
MVEAKDKECRRNCQVLGRVYGISVRSRNLAASLGMVLKSLGGGELRWFTSVLYSCRNDSIRRVVNECKRRGGNAAICLRFDVGDAGGFCADVGLRDCLRCGED